MNSREPIWTDIVTVTDDNDGEIVITESNIDSSKVDMETVGTYDVIYEVTNSSEKTETLTITISVVDTTSPVIRGLKNIVCEVGSELPNLLIGISANDNYDGRIILTLDNVNASSVDMNTAGIYEVIYTVEDENVVTEVITVTIPTFIDSNLESLIRNIIEKPTGPITQEDCESITSLDAGLMNITNISGIEYLTNLNLNYNHIIDLTPLSNLTNLSELNLSWTQTTDLTTLSNLTDLSELNLSTNLILDITSLSALTNLTELNLSWNQISDITPLSNLTYLSVLSLSFNQISNLAPLHNLTGLTELALIFNHINDITQLSNLTNLTELNLSWTQVSDISPLENMINLTNLNIENNKISDISILKTIFDNGAFGSTDPHNNDSYHIFLAGNPIDTTAESDAYKTISYLNENGILIDIYNN